MNRWQDEAKCLGSEPDLFFPGAGESAEPAKRICEQCPVKVECLQSALDTKEPGIYGGTTERERRFIKRAGWTALEVFKQKEEGTYGYNARRGRICQP